MDIIDNEIVQEWLDLQSGKMLTREKLYIQIQKCQQNKKKVPNVDSVPDLFNISSIASRPNENISLLKMSNVFGPA